MRTRMMIGLSVAAGVCATAAWFMTRPVVAADDKPAAAQPKVWVEYTTDGKVKQPVGYRKWVFLGTPLTPNDMNGGEAAFPEFHNVYMDPDSFAHLEKTGEYRDGTVLVKELTAVGTKELSSGKGYFQGEFTGLEISVKDTKRFKDEPGNWAYFSFGHKYPLKAEAAKNGAASCNKCHLDNAKDFVFSDVYPVLNAALKSAKKK
jgi:hypothetical protein